MTMNPPSSKAIGNWLRVRLAAQLKLSVDALADDATFQEYGLDSMGAVSFSGEVSDWLGLELAPTVMWDYPTIEKFAEYLAMRVQAP